jgi:hypothetical protein
MGGLISILRYLGGLTLTGKWQLFVNLIPPLKRQTDMNEKTYSWLCSKMNKWIAGSTRDRIDGAIWYLRRYAGKYWEYEGGEDRCLDNCFEMGDGDKVVQGIIARCDADPVIKGILTSWPCSRYVNLDDWRERYPVRTIATIGEGRLFAEGEIPFNLETQSDDRSGKARPRETAKQELLFA